MNSVKLFLIRKLLWFIPETRAFGFKRMLYRWAGVVVKDNVKICSSAKILGAGKLTIGADTWIGPEVILVSNSSISIGAMCDIAPRCYIGDGTHIITPKENRIAGQDIAKEIIIGDGCWLCVNSTILAGVIVGDKCIVAAGSVVTKSIDNIQALIAGIPAEIKKML